MIWQEKVDPNLIDPDMLEVRPEIVFWIGKYYNFNWNKYAL
jgi:hypothetical protein